MKRSLLLSLVKRTTTRAFTTTTNVRSIVCCLLLVSAFSLAGNKVSGQVIVESFEQAAFSSITGTTAGTYIVSASVPTSLTTATSYAITTYSGNATTNTATTTTVAPKSTGTWTWVYSAGSAFVSTAGSALRRREGAAWYVAKSGYLITPYIPQGISSISFWVATGGSTTTAMIGLNTVTTQNTYGSYTSTQVGMPSTFTFNSSSVTGIASTMTGNSTNSTAPGWNSLGQYSFTVATSNTMPAQFAFFQNGSGTIVMVDDIVITPALSDVSTGTAGSITNNSATITGSVLMNSSASAVTENGVCYNTSPNPTISNTKVINGSNVNGSFNSNLSGLGPSTYYVRSYATNGLGTYYGNQISFATLAPEPDNYATGFAASVNTTSNSQGSLILTWTDAIGANLPAGYLIRGSSVGYGSITTPTDGVAVSDGGLDKNVTYGTQTATITGLSTNTQYFFQIYSYSGGGAGIDYKTSAVPAGAQATGTTASNTVAGQPFRSLTTGNWSAAATWQSFDGVNWVTATSAPNNGTPSTITIRDGHTVTLDQSATVTSLTVGEGTSGALVYQNTTTVRALTVNTDVTVATGGSFTCGTQGASVIHTLAISGNLTVNGTGAFDMRGSSTTRACNTTFNGTSNVTIGGTASGTVFFNIVIINLNSVSTKLTVSVNVTTNNLTNSITLTQGNLEITGGTTTTPNTFIVPVTTGQVTVAGGTLSTGGSLTLNGSATVSSGTLSVGTAAGNSINYGDLANLTISGGNVNVAGRVSYVVNTNRLNFTMSGGTLSAPTVDNSGSTGTFDIATTGSSFTMSGGTIIIKKPSIGATQIDYRNMAGTTNITGGTVQFGDASLTGTPTFTVSGLAANPVAVFPNLTINTTSSPTVQLGIASATSFSGISVTGNLTISTGTTLNANTNTNTTAKTISLTGDWSNSGTFTSTGSTVTFNGSGAQGITKAGGETFNNLTLSNASNITLNNALTIDGGLNVTTGTLTTGANNITLNASVGSAIFEAGTTLNINNAGSTVDFNNRPVYFRSGAGGTARIAKIVGTLSDATVVVAERYIPSRRAWRLLTAPVTGTTVNAAWQGGFVNPDAGTNLPGTAGYATHITGGTFGNGFDQTQSNASSIKIYSGVATWTTPSATSLAIESQPGWMLFVRGDRTMSLAPGTTTSTQTVLQPTGTLKQGNQSTINLADAVWQVVGNPYPSNIDFEQFAGTTNLGQDFYVWDANQTGSHGLGAFVLVTRNGANDYVTTPSVTGGTSWNLIQNGQAVFMRGQGGTAALALTEDAKTSSGPTSNVYRTNGTDPEVMLNLNVVESGVPTVLDGLRVKYNPSFSKSVTSEDVNKMMNFGENIASYRSNTSLIVERRPDVLITNDTVFLRITNASIKSYSFDIDLKNFAAGVTATLEDAFLNSSTVLSITGNTTVNFDITSATGSQLNDRFMIVFRPSSPLPVTFHCY
jgi:hypothetical protein